MFQIDLHGKVAVVTGASSGLGVQFALALARAGADVAIVARRVEKLTQTAEKIKALGVRVLQVKCDVTKNSDIKAAVKTIQDEFGRIDILVNNAGLGWTAPAETQTDEVWDTMVSTNINGVYYFAREVAGQMIQQKYGKIINIGSIHSAVAFKGMPMSAYATTKGAVWMMTKALATEWAPHNITVNAIGPGYFPSEMTDGALGDEGFNNIVKNNCPMSRTGRDGELDGALLYFASDLSSYTTGQMLWVDGGWTAV